MDIRTIALGLVATAGMASAQFTITGNNVASAGPATDPLNGVVSATYNGPNTIATSFTFTGTLVSGGTGTFASEADWAPLINGADALTAANNPFTTLSLGFQGGNTFSTPINVGPVTVNGLFWLQNGTNYGWRAQESFNDGGVDATWSSASFAYSGAFAGGTSLGSFAEGTALTFSTAASPAASDTELGLYNAATGQLIATNDDISGTDFRSILAAGSLAVGDYVLVLGAFNTIFGDQIAIAASGSTAAFNLSLNGSGIAAGNFTPGQLRTFSFSIVPAPSSLALLGLGGLAAARRRRA